MKSINLTKDIKDKLVKALAEKANLNLFESRKLIGKEISHAAQSIANTFYKKPEDKKVFENYNVLSSCTYITYKTIKNEEFKENLSEFKYYSFKSIIDGYWKNPVFENISITQHEALQASLVKEKKIKEKMKLNFDDIQNSLKDYNTSAKLLKDIPELEPILKEVICYKEPNLSPKDQIKFLKKIALIPDKPLLECKTA